jgi:hypothetical protein
MAGLIRLEAPGALGAGGRAERGQRFGPCAPASRAPLRDRPADSEWQKVKAERREDDHSSLARVDDACECSEVRGAVAGRDLRWDRH